MHVARDHCERVGRGQRLDHLDNAVDERRVVVFANQLHEVPAGGRRLGFVADMARQRLKKIAFENREELLARVDAERKLGIGSRKQWP